MYFLCISLGIQNVWLSYQKNKYIYISTSWKKEKKIYLHFGPEPDAQALICSRASDALQLGSGWEPPVRMWILLPPRGQPLLRAQHRLLLPLGLIYREHLQESVMGKGEVWSDNPNTQKVLCRLGLVNFTNKGKKKQKQSKTFLLWGKKSV